MDGHLASSAASLISGLCISTPFSHLSYFVCVWICVCLWSLWHWTRVITLSHKGLYCQQQPCCDVMMSQALGPLCLLFMLTVRNAPTQAYGL